MHQWRCSSMHAALGAADVRGKVYAQAAQPSAPAGGPHSPSGGSDSKSPSTLAVELTPQMSSTHQSQ
jgi:hypothetical protein